MPDLKVLYLEDEHLLGRIVKESLESRGCRIDWYENGRAAAPALRKAGAYDIALLDVQLPGEDGFTIGQQLRKNFPHLPILYLTARVQPQDVLTGFRAGGNDYVKKPFSMEELLVRMENLVRMRQGQSSDVNNGTPTPSLGKPDTYVLGHFLFDYPQLRLVHRPPGQTEKTFPLSHREAELLRLFVKARGETVIPRRDILMALWKDDSFFHSRNLDVYVRKLRRLLAPDSRVRILTLRGVGYRFVVEAEEQ